MSLKKIPKKQELLKLQALYKTDKRIGEALGGIPAYLVAYWRRKKGIGTFDLPKYSKEKILEVWERHGDDKKAGKELGISKAGFYKWRKKYKIFEKPGFLKYKQLELGLPLPPPSKRRASLTMGEKILARKSKRKDVHLGQKISLEPDFIFCGDKTHKIIEIFSKKKYTSVANPEKVILSYGQNQFLELSEACRVQSRINQFANTYKIKKFLCREEPLCLGGLLEKIVVLPAQFLVSSSNQFYGLGCVGALAYKISEEEMAEVLHTGRLETFVPQSVRINLEGKIPAGISALDIGLAIASKLSEIKIKKYISEITGPVLKKLSMGERFSLTCFPKSDNLYSILFPFDEIQKKYLSSLTKKVFLPAYAEIDARYYKSYDLDVSYLEPKIASIFPEGEAVPISKLKKFKIQEGILSDSPDGSLEELQPAAKILKQKKISGGVKLNLLFQSSKSFWEATNSGILKIFLESGAEIFSPAYLWSHTFPLHFTASEKTCLSSINPDLTIEDSCSEFYLASPATVAASALKGELTDPREFL